MIIIITVEQEIFATFIFCVFHDLTEFAKVYSANLSISQYKHIIPACKTQNRKILCQEFFPLYICNKYILITILRIYLDISVTVYSFYHLSILIDSNVCVYMCMYYHDIVTYLLNPETLLTIGCRQIMMTW